MTFFDGWVRDVGAGLSFFTRWPLPASAHAVPLADAARAVPIAGLVAALPGAIVLLLLSGADPLVAAIAATALLVVSTGALHEDGFADVADGFWGGKDATSRLEIMRDSRLGTYGVAAVVLALIAKVACIAVLMKMSPLFAAGAVLAAALMARTAALDIWIAGPAARPDGLAAQRPTEASFHIAALSAAGRSVALIFWQAPAGVISATFLLLLTVKGLGLLARRKIGGVTGDVIGAAIVAGDLVYLGTLAIWASP